MIGDMRHKALICRKTVESDGYGGQVATWQQPRKVWAAIRQASGTETIDMQSVVNAKTRQLIIRRTDILPSDEITMDGKDWLISDIEQLDGKEYYLLVSIRAKEVSS